MANSLLWLKRFLERPEVDLLRPGGPMLAMDVPVRFGDRIDAEHAVLAALGGAFGVAGADAIAIDRAVDDDMRDMDAGGAEVAGHALRDGALARLGRGAIRVAGL